MSHIAYLFARVGEVSTLYPTHFEITNLPLVDLLHFDTQPSTCLLLLRKEEGRKVAYAGQHLIPLPLVWVRYECHLACLRPKGE